MNLRKIFEENQKKQLELDKNKKAFCPKRIYRDELNDLINISYGFKKSFERSESVDSENRPIPWMTYPAIFYLSQLDLTKCRIFEWGSGNSTVYFSERAKTVTAVESKKEWFDYVDKSRAANVDLRLVDQDNYAKIISQFDSKYDVISIDGDIYRRYECSYYAVDALNDGGMIILDNSDWLPKTTEYLRSKDFIQVDFCGLGPINNYAWCTSIFFSRRFKIRNLNAEQPGFLQGGLKNCRD